MTIEDLKLQNYEFECDLDESYKDKQTDEWGCAFIWINGEIGVEYNFCIDGSTNSCAIYKMELNPETEYIETDYSLCTHYEIDFDDVDWKQKLENAMCEACISFFYS